MRRGSKTHKHADGVTAFLTVFGASGCHPLVAHQRAAKKGCVGLDLDIFNSPLRENLGITRGFLTFMYGALRSFLIASTCRRAKRKRKNDQDFGAP
jgi:hypothetical protein